MTMETFAIALIHDTALVFQLSRKESLQSLNEIATALAERAFQGTVIFDLLLSNRSTSSSRFVQAAFSHGQISHRSLKTAHEVDENILKIVSQFYQENPHLLQSSSEKPGNRY